MLKNLKLTVLRDVKIKLMLLGIPQILSLWSQAMKTVLKRELFKPVIREIRAGFELKERTRNMNF